MGIGLFLVQSYLDPVKLTGQIGNDFGMDTGV